MIVEYVATGMQKHIAVFGDELRPRIVSRGVISRTTQARQRQRKKQGFARTSTLRERRC